MKAMKFRVVSEEDSKRIQTALFKEGYAWMKTRKNFMHTDKPYLLAGGFGEDDNCITYIGNDFEYFNDFKVDEYVLTPQGKFVKIAEYYKQPETPKLNIPDRYENPQNEEDKAVKGYFTKILEQLYPTEITLRPKEEVGRLRKMEILEAMLAKLSRKEEVPQPWFEEFSGLFLPEQHQKQFVKEGEF